MLTRSLTITAISAALLAFTARAEAQPAPAAGSLKAAINAFAQQGAPPFIFLLTPSQAGRAAEAVNAIEAVAALEISTAPIGSSSGGFTYTFDGQLQTWKRSSQSFGPLFLERALTTGKGKGSVGFNYLHSHYNSIGGMDLSDGSFMSLKGAQVAGSPIVSSRVKEEASSDRVVGHIVFGVTNDLDIGVAIPWARVSIALDQAFYNAAGTDISVGHHTVVPTTSSSGIGDVLVFGKYHFWHHEGGGLAGEVSVQFPSGDTDNLRGAGVTRTSLLAIFSQPGKISPHVNVGAELWSSKVPISIDGSIYAQNQVKYAAGVEIEAHPRATVVIDFIGRRLMHGGRLGFETIPLGALGSFQGLVGIAEGINDISISPSVKWNPFGRAVISVGLLGSLVNDGLRANMTPVVGLDWSF